MKGKEVGLPCNKMVSSHFQSIRKEAQGQEEGGISVPGGGPSTDRQRGLVGR